MALNRRYLQSMNYPSETEDYAVGEAGRWSENESTSVDDGPAAQSKGFAVKGARHADEGVFDYSFNLPQRTS